VIPADSHGKLVWGPAGHAGHYEANGIDAARRVDPQNHRLCAVGPAVPDGGHRCSLRSRAGATTVTNVVVGVCRVGSHRA
jgi:hypothetical protein